MPDNLTRCTWAEADPLSRRYHDTQWGKPCHDERMLFKMLILEGKQAGLAWITILRKWETMGQTPAKTALSDTINRELKRFGFKFVGSTIVYSWLQAVGVVNDHIASCAFRG
jgi:DNA-3-methyladenine glycosylase I